MRDLKYNEMRRKKLNSEDFLTEKYEIDKWYREERNNQKVELST